MRTMGAGRLQQSVEIDPARRSWQGPFSPNRAARGSLGRLAGLIALLAGAICAGCAAPVKQGCPARDGEAAETVHLVVHGWHAGIVFPRRDSVLAWPVAADLAGTEYLEVGWGDRDFYQAQRPHWYLALKAILLPTASVLHVAGFDGPVAAQFPDNEIVSIQLSVAAFDRLSRYVGDSFATDEQGRAVDLGGGLYGHSRFYLSRDTYHAFNTCNVWTAAALRAAGCATVPGAALTVDGLLRQLCGLAEPIASAGCAHDSVPPPRAARR